MGSLTAVTDMRPFALSDVAAVSADLSASLMNCGELLPGVPLEGRKRYDPHPGEWIVRQEVHGRRDFPVMLSCYMFE